MAKTIGCIGLGNMGSALMKGFAGKLDASSWRLFGYNRTKGKMDALAGMGIEPMPDIKATAAVSDILIFAVKPGQLPDILELARPYLKKDCLALSVAAGYKLASMREILGSDCAIVRCMPTTTALAGRGVFAFCHDPLNFTREDHSLLLELFSLLGQCIELPESRFADFSALIGAGPAYIFQMMHALCQAGVTLGFTRQECRSMLTELVAGCAALAGEQYNSYMQLRDEVCSPAGLTIEGINVLERCGFTGQVIDAVLAARRRGREMES